MWCIQEIDSVYRERMYDVLDLYSELYDPRRPVIGLDEKPKQLLEDVRTPIPMRIGKPAKYDYEYKRRGSVNIFVAVEPKAGRRKAKVTKRRTKQDFAQFIKELVDEEYKDAEVLRIVLDNLNTHSPKSLFDTFSREEAERILQKVEFHHTPNHGSWLNIAEIEINVMDCECTGRRMKNIDYLSEEVGAWETRRNHYQKKISWSFTKQDADKKLSKYYVTELNS